MRESEKNAMSNAITETSEHAIEQDAFDKVSLKKDSLKRNGGIKVRRMDFEFPDDIPEFWFDNDPFMTAFMTSLSVSFPAGERYFIDSVRHFESQIKNPVLKAQIRGFIGQEANHTKEHIAFNQFMDRKGYPASGMEKFVRDRIAWIQKKSTPEENLARTVALEHLTAIMAGAFIDNPEIFEKMDPRIANIWAWHAVEEVEHRSVAFDVFKTAVNDEALRVRTMANVTLLFSLVNIVRTLILLNTSGNLFNAKSWWKGLNVMWGRPGIFRKIIPAYFSYYKSAFHPDQHDQFAQVEAAKLRYLGNKA